jgi:phage/plasmid-associated DNA primase
MKDKRLLVHSEGSSKKTINTQTLKRITGNSSIKLDSTKTEFVIRGKIIEDTNYLPYLDNTEDEAFNDRLVVIPFSRNTNITTVNKLRIMYLAGKEWG